jgi:GT2 family glycosyltransferase/acetyltransferase-like isoleucine patch superfamily enzyme
MNKYNEYSEKSISEFNKTSIIMLTYNQLENTKLCIGSIRKYTVKEEYEIIVVDNNSTDGTVQWLSEQKDIKTIMNNENLGFPKGCNQGIKIAKGKNILLLNNDTIVTPKWLKNLIIALYSDNTVGAVGAATNFCSNNQVIPGKYNNTDELIEFAEKNNISDSKRWEEKIKLVGFCMLIKKEVIEKIGFLDEIYSPGNFEDDDYSFRIRKEGYRLLLCKDVFIHHFGSVSFNKDVGKFKDLLRINKEKFKNKWGFEPEYCPKEIVVNTDVNKENTDKKICFITCVDDNIQYQKSLNYIRNLIVPEGYKVECICIKDAKSMTGGYNLAMEKSDAKYKIYIHQDVFIVNKHFLVDILKTFHENSNIGMLGVVGAKTLLQNCIWWESNYKYGKVYDSHSGELGLLNFNNPKDEFECVKAIDGLIMITQYDVKWREDIFNGWHFYDVSQSLEFLNLGYDVAVVKQEKAWCIHDCGVVDINNGFDEYRSIFYNQYKNNPCFYYYKFGVNSVVGAESEIECPEGISIGNNVVINKGAWITLPYKNFNGEPRVIISDGCNIGRRCKISASKYIFIGENVLMESNVCVKDYTPEYRIAKADVKDIVINSSNCEISIGSGTWIGENSVIVGNVKIGRGCIISENSRVDTDIPDYCIASGNPAVCR